MPEKRPKTPTVKQLDVAYLARQQEIGRNLALTMLRGSDSESQSRVSTLRGHLLGLPEISGLRSQVETEVTYIDSLDLDKTLRPSKPGDTQFTAAKLVLEDGSKLLVLDIHEEDSRRRSIAVRDFTMAMERPRDLAVELLGPDHARVEDRDRLCWRLDPVTPVPAPVVL